MRGREEEQGAMLLSITPEELVPSDHPIRRIRAITDRALQEMSPVLNTMYSGIGRPSVAPERLLKASILMALYSIRSERQFCERLQYDLLFKWFLNMNIATPAFDHASFSKNRERLIKHAVAEQFFAAVMDEATKAKLISDDHFTVDGTLLQAWAALKSVKPRDDDRVPPASGGKNADIDFHGQRRTNETHVSTTDPEARIARKGRGQEARLCFGGHVLMENRNGLVLDVLVTQASGTAEPTPRSSCSTVAKDHGSESPWARTKATTRVPSSKNYASARSPRTSPSTRRSGEAPSMGGRRSTTATGLASECASASRRSSAG
jgi:transposase